MANIKKSDEEWREQLSQESFEVTRKAATERPFTGKYWDFDKKGTYKCICCGAPLFESDTKFDAGCGWPSFFLPLNETAIAEAEDKSLGLTRTEVKCSQCDAHLGLSLIHI